MRTLRVVGIHEDGKSIVCEDPEHREQFLLPADERLRAAARGDATRLGQIEIERESQMRPREIQARVRAGESVEQLADASGLPEARIERFAYPVLLERSRHAELVQQAHPIREDGPDVQTLGEVVAHAFSLRGQDYAQAQWDTWRGEDARWVACLRWSAGRSTNKAHWSYSPGAHGGTVTALDELAGALLDPASYRAPRAVERATEPRSESLSGDLADPIGDGEPAATRTNVIAAPLPGREEAHDADDAADGDHGEHRDHFDHGGADEADRHGPADVESAGTGTDGVDRPTQTELVESPGTTSKPKSRKKNHPAVPAWEDVLLGVRSQRG